MLRPVAFSVALCLGFAVLAADKEPAAQTAVGGLDNPSGIAIHSSGDIFIAARDGIHRLTAGKPGKLVPEVTGFKTDIYGKGPMYNIGPLCVACIGDNRILVGDGSLLDAQEVALVFKVGPKPPAKPTDVAKAEQKLGPIGPGQDSAKGEGNFYAIALTKDAAYFTSNGDDTKGWILKADVNDGKVGELKPFIATKTLVNVDAPVGITLDPEGKHLVVGQMGEVNVAGDSLLTKYDFEGKLVSSVKTGLSDIAALAYSPKTGKLYCVDYAWADTKQGGLFRLEEDGDTVKATKIASLDKPTAMAFDKEGNLYIAVFGSPDNKKAGAILKFASGL